MSGFGSNFLKNVIWVFLVLFGLTIFTGCTHTLQNDGIVGFKLSTEWAFFHRASKTTGSGEDDVAKSNTEIPALVEWLFPGPPAEGQVVPENPQ